MLPPALRTADSSPLSVTDPVPCRLRPVTSTRAQRNAPNNPHKNASGRGVGWGVGGWREWERGAGGGFRV